MDSRAIICGVLAGVAMVCGTILTAIGVEQSGVVCFGLASTCAGYAVGLYSEPRVNASTDTGSDDA